MARPILSADHFHNEQAAFDYVEAMLWPEGPTCPHCGVYGDKIGRLTGKTSRIGLRKCYGCRKTFTVRNGTIFEDSHLALHLWLQAIHLLTSSKKGISTRQIQRLLECSMKTAWFLTHRIREIMSDAAPEEPMGGNGKIVEIDETFFGRDPKKKIVRGPSYKQPILSLVERGGKVRSFHISGTSKEQMLPYVYKNVAQDSHIMTDEYRAYRVLRDDYTSHETVNHSKDEYVRGQVTTNTIEGFFSIFKRGMKGVYQHCSEQHLQRYLHEFDFRYSNREKLGIDDATRTALAIQGAKGKRLTYQTANSSKAPD